MGGTTEEVVEKKNVSATFGGGWPRFEKGTSMFLIFLRLCAALCLLAAPASAATYSYQSLPFTCGYGPDMCFTPDGLTWSGSFSIDEAVLPGQSLANSTLDVSLSRVGTDAMGYDLYEYGLSFASPNGAVSFASPVGFAFFSYTGFLNEFLGSTVVSGNFSWSFDAAGEVASWNGDNYCGGSCDPHSSSLPVPFAEFGGYDFYYDGSSTAGPGTWTRVTDPAAVPVPLTAASLGLALTALGLTRRRRQPA